MAVCTSDGCVFYLRYRKGGVAVVAAVGEEQEIVAAVVSVVNMGRRVPAAVVTGYHLELYIMVIRIPQTIAVTLDVLLIITTMPSACLSQALRDKRRKEPATVSLDHAPDQTAAPAVSTVPAPRTPPLPDIAEARNTWDASGARKQDQAFQVGTFVVAAPRTPPLPEPQAWA